MIKIKLKKKLAEMLILLIKLLFLLKKIIKFILYYAIYKPIKTILEFLFFKLIINLYYKYILLYKKIKEVNKKNNSRLYVIKKNYPIILIIIIGLFLVINDNLNGSKNFTNRINKTVLAQNIVTDFSVSEPEELIVEIGFEQRPSVIGQTKYLDQGGSLRGVRRVVLSYVEEDIPIQSDTLNRPAIATTPRNRDARREIEEYVVQAGDTISSIAIEFGLNANTILWENNLTARSLIRPGNTIRILPENGIMHTVARNENIASIAKRYNVSSELIINSNNLNPEDALQLSQKIFIPGGRRIIPPAPVRRSIYAGTAIARPSPGAVATNFTGGKLLWPTVGHRITQYYSWRHKGLDIANRTGTPLYAAESGTVEMSGWSRGYGYNVIINHGGGLRTLYAHASELHVRAGDVVNRGDIIADMGSTGWSTGPHIHFEVILNGVRQNPLNFLR